MGPRLRGQQLIVSSSRAGRCRDLIDGLDDAQAGGFKAIIHRQQVRVRKPVRRSTSRLKRASA